MRIVCKFGEMWARNSQNIERVPRKKDGGRGVYFLYDGSAPVYVGKGNLHSRIYRHKLSKKRGQLWDRFSWYALSEHEMMHDIESLILRMLPPYLRSLTKQKGKFEDADEIPESKENRIAEFI